ncbi:MAG: aminopeptidase P N-terminal domain-containing protein [Planctomycetota bacterium]|jgi:Xaa-Pro aminopeptidase|nr:aminopeptidase P N-terminal domain-containing protein [Planctomycetota bacterium]
MLAFLTTSILALAAVPQQEAEDGRGQSLFTSQWHSERREALLDFMDEKEPGVIVLRGAGAMNDYRAFRQDNNFWYFTGVTTPDAVLVMTTDTREQYLLVPEVGALDERWMGDLIDKDEAAELTGIKDVRTLKKNSRGAVRFVELKRLLDELLKDRPKIYMQRRPAENWMMSRDNLTAWEGAMATDGYDGRVSREAKFAERLEEVHKVEVVDMTVSLDGMRVIKTPEEVEAMRRACIASGEGHKAAMRTGMPGDYEWQLAARMTYEFQMAGGRGLGGYAAIATSGINACTLHYFQNTRMLEEDEMVMIDYGADYNHYIADISRSWPTGEKFTERQREVYQAVYDAQEAAFKECKPGSNLGRVHRAAQKVLIERGFGTMWHGTSHWLGMSTHDVGRSNAAFEPGMAITVEPGIYLPDEELGVRIEDVVVITEDGCEVISSMIPRHPDAIEALRKEAFAAKK